MRIKANTQKGFYEMEPGDGLDLIQPKSKTRRGRVQKGKIQTITTGGGLATMDNNYRIRKLTPGECWRLMGFNDSDYEKAAEVNSTTQLYKQRGNSIVVQCLEGVFRQLTDKAERPERNPTLNYKPYFVMDRPIRLIELFRGIGRQRAAMRNLGLDFERYRRIEWDRFAIASYNRVHGTNFKTQDITKTTRADLGIVETDKYIYLMTYSFPCQDLSLAGKRRGMSKGEGTRSGLLWEVERLLNEAEELPQVLVMENVPQVHGKANKADFDKWIEYLTGRGYCNYWADLNAKNYGIPQNRNRCFMVSILGNYLYDFPKPIQLKNCLRDFLDDEVPEKYYLSDDQIEHLVDHKRRQEEKGNGFGWNPTDGGGTGRSITTRSGQRQCDNYIIDHDKK